MAIIKNGDDSEDESQLLLDEQGLSDPLQQGKLDTLFLQCG